MRQRRRRGLRRRLGAQTRKRFYRSLSIYYYAFLRLSRQSSSSPVANAGPVPFRGPALAAKATSDEGNKGVGLGGGEVDILRSWRRRSATRWPPSGSEPPFGKRPPSSPLSPPPPRRARPATRRACQRPDRRRGGGREEEESGGGRRLAGWRRGRTCAKTHPPTFFLLPLSRCWSRARRRRRASRARRAFNVVCSDRREMQGGMEA